MAVQAQRGGFSGFAMPPTPTGADRETHLKEKCVGKGPGDPPRIPSAGVAGHPLALRENTLFLVKVVVLPRENHTLRKRSVLQPPKQVT